MNHLADFFEGIRLPTMPEVAQTLIKSLNDDDIPLETIRNTISKDPSLTAKLIRLANSARFGLAKKVSSVDDAITMIGLNQVRTLALAACMNDSFPVLPGINREVLWKESMACAGYAHWLARTVGADGQQAWLTGFMIRLGELLIAQKDPAVLQQIEQTPVVPGVRWERETRYLGFTEGHIAGELAKRWNFPPEIAEALAASSDPLAHKPFARLAAIVHIAMLLAETAVEDSKSPADTIASLPQDLLVKLQLPVEWLTEHLPDVSTFTDTAL